jgi:hypothetical protein
VFADRGLVFDYEDTIKQGDENVNNEASADDHHTEGSWTGCQNHQYGSCQGHKVDEDNALDNSRGEKAVLVHGLSVHDRLSQNSYARLTKFLQTHFRKTWLQHRFMSLTTLLHALTTCYSPEDSASL